MRKNEPISRIMSTDIQAVQQGQPLSEVYQILCNTGVHHVPILDSKKLVGLISLTDMMKLDMAIQGADGHTLSAVLDQQFTVKDVMTKSLVTLTNESNVRDAAEQLGTGKFHALPVVNGDDELLGMVTSTDLIRYLSEQY
ncbi:MAG: CBS domain-containing protein [Gammaproteobacteria bacterium]